MLSTGRVSRDLCGERGMWHGLHARIVDVCEGRACGMRRVWGVGAECGGRGTIRLDSPNSAPQLCTYIEIAPLAK